MQLTSVLYISRSLIPFDDREAALAQIIAHATVANAAKGMTGALLFTGTHFAQVIEGNTQDLDNLLAALRCDDRHDNLQVVDRAPLVRRRFANWSMAYFGPSQFVARHVTRLINDLSPAGQHRGAEWLTELMHEFAKA